MTIIVDVEKRLDTFSIQASFESAGRLTALFGRSGAGKTTLVNLIAGLVRPDRGRVVIDGDTLVDTAAGIEVPAHRRRVGYVFQDARLFPHMSVRSNLLYGRRRAPRRDRTIDFDAIVGLLGIAHLVARRPADLSGGERQRVALGRALLAGPRLLLMDEPLAALDEARKADLLPYVERLRDEMRLPIVYVSHSVEEVARLADTVVVMADGQVVASGEVNEVFGRADLSAVTGQYEASTVLTATVEGQEPAVGLTVLRHPAGLLYYPLIERPVGAEVRIRIRARDVALAVGDPGRLSIRNRLAATVVDIRSGPPPIVDVRLDAAGAPLVASITREAANDLGLAPGTSVTALIKSATFDRPALLDSALPRV